MSNRTEPPYTPEQKAMLNDLEEAASANANDWCPYCGAHWPDRLSAREPLVQEVIEGFREFTAATSLDERVRIAVKNYDSVKKLAEFRHG